jgi:hypothetical protein
MPARRGRHLAALAGYSLVAIVYSWPLPLQLSTAVLGPVAQDTGVYIWNLWVFRHEILAHHQLPFTTYEILSLSPRVPLALHNYTTAANLAAFPLLPILGTVATYNVLLLVSSILAAYAMFLFARRAVGDGAAAWIAGLLFGFSPYMSARASEHFSLVQTAPLVLFAWLFDRLRTVPTVGAAAAAGAAVALAFLSDVYYAVYCLLLAGFAIAYSAVALKDHPVPAPLWRRSVLNVAIICLAGLVAGIVLRGGGRFQLLGVRVSMTQLYTPVLLLTAAVAARLWMSVRSRLTWGQPLALPSLRVTAVAVIVCAAILSPVLAAAGVYAAGERRWISPRIFWRSSAPGLDLLTPLIPNPLHPWFGSLPAGWLQQQPHTFVENVASVPWTAIILLLIAWRLSRTALPRYWVAFTAFFAWLALGPFVHIAGWNLYVPTPWALLRYLPVVGAARMPPRFIALVIFGVAVLAAFAMRDLRSRVRQPAWLVAVVTALLIFEMFPAPRTLYSAEVPDLYRIVAADSRPVALLSLPLGLRDGMSSHGNGSAAPQFFQTVHEKPIIGGYISRLPRNNVAEYRNRRVTSALLDLSEGRPLTPERRAAVIQRAHDILPTLKIGYVVVNRARASEDLIQFAKEAFDLTEVAVEGPRVLFRTPLAALPN